MFTTTEPVSGDWPDIFSGPSLLSPPPSLSIPRFVEIAAVHNNHISAATLASGKVSDRKTN